MIGLLAASPRRLAEVRCSPTPQAGVNRYCSAPTSRSPPTPEGSILSDVRISTRFIATSLTGAVKFGDKGCTSLLLQWLCLQYY